MPKTGERILMLYNVLVNDHLIQWPRLGGRCRGVKINGNEEVTGFQSKRKSETGSEKK